MHEGEFQEELSGIAVLQAIWIEESTGAEASIKPLQEKEGVK